MQSWVLGFVTAVNNVSMSLGAPLRATDANAMEAWVDKYCREHPLDPVASAAANLVGALGPQPSDSAQH